MLVFLVQQFTVPQSIFTLWVAHLI